MPVYCFRPAVLAEDARAFVGAFPGKTAYAVKTNGEPFVLQTLAEPGIKAFDVASPGEFAAVRAVSADAELLYMHPVKAQSDIRLALEHYGMRVLSLDHEDEIAKLLRIVRALDLDPADITLFVRLRTKGPAAYELSRKFGAAPSHAVELLQRIDRIGFRAGLCFHVGSQIEDPEVYQRALASADWVRSRAGVALAGLDIGGGFPAPYGHDPRRAEPAMPSLAELMAEIRRAIDEWGFSDLPLIAEPGRVIVARSLSVIVRVLLKKGRRLYINDGIWGSLSDSWTGKITLPARLIHDPARRAAKRQCQDAGAVPRLRRDLRFRRHPVAPVLAAGNRRHRRLDRDRPYRRLQPGAPHALQRLLSRHLRGGDDAVRGRQAAGGFRGDRDDGGLSEGAK